MILVIQNSFFGVGGGLFPVLHHPAGKPSWFMIVSEDGVGVVHQCCD